jgi:hypothetical protein
MSVRLKIALTILLAGLLTAIGVVVTMVLAFQRFEYESAYQRAMRSCSACPASTRSCWKCTDVHTRPGRIVPAQSGAVRARRAPVPAGFDRGPSWPASGDLRATRADDRVPLGPCAMRRPQARCRTSWAPTRPIRRGPVIVAAWRVAPAGHTAGRQQQTASCIWCASPCQFSRDRVEHAARHVWREPGLMMILLLVVRAWRCWPCMGHCHHHAPLAGLTTSRGDSDAVTACTARPDAAQARACALFRALKRATNSASSPAAWTPC